MTKSMIATLLLFHVCISAGMADNNILSIDAGLTLAEVKQGDERRTVAVISDLGSTISGYDISAHFGKSMAPIALYAEQGYQAISEAILQADETSLKQYPYAELLSPAGGLSHHFAAGLNYADHADEVDAEATPFIFLKTTRPTREAAVFYDSTRLLDYEVEICARPLHRLSDEVVQEHDFAYFLCGDFTDRATLLRNIDLNRMQSGRGFSVSKSLPTYFPTGPYLFIPKPNTQPLNALSLELNVNGALRQQSDTSELIWSIEEIVREIRTANEEHRETHSAVSFEWLPNGVLDSRFTILTGTPDGVIMAPPDTGYRVTRGIWYVLSGAFLSERYNSVKEYVVNLYVEDLLKTGTFLKPGDKLTLSATGLGTIHLNIGGPQP